MNMRPKFQWTVLLRMLVFVQIGRRLGWPQSSQLHFTVAADAGAAFCLVMAAATLNSRTQHR